MILNALSTNDINHICFTLESSKREQSVVVAKGDKPKFDKMRLFFSKRIKEDRSKGVLDFDVFLEADEGTSMMDQEMEALEADDDDLL